MNTAPRKHLKTLGLFFIVFLLFFCLNTPSGGWSKTNVPSNPPLTMEQMTEEIKALIEYEVDGFYLLDNAALNMKNKKIKNWLINFKEERKAHIKTLMRVLLKETSSKDYSPPSLGKFKGFYKGIYFEPKNSADDHAVLQTLFENEKSIIEAYEKALKLQFPKKTHIKIKNIYKHNKQHNAYLDHLAKTLS